MSQCTTEKILLDSVFSMVEKRQTEQAFILFNSLDQSRVDPRGKLSICIEAYESGDTDLFKTVLLDLVVQHGFRNDSSTTGMLFADDITTGRHANWFGQLQDSCSMIFERTHIQRMVVINALRRIYARDQSRAMIYRTAVRESLADSIVIGLDNEDFEELLYISEHYGLPNGFEDLYNAGGIVELVLWHCGKHPTGFQERWDAILPYVDEAFKLGKGDNGFAYIYDMTLNYHCGQQYYGTLSAEVPVRDPEGLRARRTKYCLR